MKRLVCPAGLRRVLPLAFALSLAACASIPPGAGSNPADPYERVNREVYSFNEAFDRWFATPLARGYEVLLPDFVRNCIHNAFLNLGEIGNAVNAGLQGSARGAASDAGRFAVNSTLGVLGCFDLAKVWGLERDRQDFGLTMGKWGMTPGPYLVLPVLGPSSLRDAVGEIPDFYTSPLSYLRPPKVYYLAYGVQFVDRRSAYLQATELVEQAALDPYAFVRDGYLQRRRSRVYNGEPPPEPVDDPDAPDPAPGR